MASQLWEVSFYKSRRQVKTRLGAAKGTCDNKLLVRRSLVEKIIVDMLLERLSDPQHIEYIVRRVEAEVGGTLHACPRIDPLQGD